MTNPNDLIRRGDALAIVQSITTGHYDPKGWLQSIAALSARPDAPDVRVVMVAQLERLCNSLNELDGHRRLDDEIRDSVISEILAIIGETKE